MVNYLHQQDISHRDLKPINLLFDIPPMEYKQAKIMVIDFGIAIHIKDNETNSNVVGTYKYMPPEIIKRRKGSEIKKGDVWGIGLIAYILMIGALPFDNDSNGQNWQKILEKTRKERIKWPLPQSNGVSDEFKNFISKCLHKQVLRRLDAQQALEHSWIVNPPKRSLHFVDSS